MNESAISKFKELFCEIEPADLSILLAEVRDNYAVLALSNHQDMIHDNAATHYYYLKRIIDLMEEAAAETHRLAS
jgi:hypothetical protein